jgi:diguanylate cyclase (GGDEF)-like protein
MNDLRDELTGLFNRTFFDTELERLSKVRGIKVGVIVCDVNDTGSVVSSNENSDKAIVEFSEILKHSFRESDVIARIEGNEFGIIVDDATEDILVTASERLLKKVEAFNNTRPDSKISVYINWSLSESFYGNVKKAFHEARSKRKK